MGIIFQICLIYLGYQLLCYDLFVRSLKSKSLSIFKISFFGNFLHLSFQIPTFLRVVSIPVNCVDDSIKTFFSFIHIIKVNKDEEFLGWIFY